MAEESEKVHEKIARRVEDISMTTGIVSAAAGVGASLAAPTGLSAIGVALGLTSAPFIVTAAPIIGVAATVVGAVSGGAYFYAKWKNKQHSENIESFLFDNGLSNKQIKEIKMLENAHAHGFLSDADFNKKIEIVVNRIN
jgi:hypothetical protein